MNDSSYVALPDSRAGGLGRRPSLILGQGLLGLAQAASLALAMLFPVGWHEQVQQPSVVALPGPVVSPPNPWLKIEKPLFAALIANCSLLAAWAALSGASGTCRTTVLLVAYAISGALYWALMPYFDVDGLAFIAFAPGVVLAVLLFARRFGLDTSPRREILAAERFHVQFSLKSLMAFILALGMLCGLEVAVSKCGVVGWRYFNIVLYSPAYAAVTLAAGWFVLRERRFINALAMTAISLVIVSCTVAFAVRRGPFGTPSFLGFTWDAAQELAVHAALQLPALIILRSEGLRLIGSRDKKA